MRHAGSKESGAFCCALEFSQLQLVWLGEECVVPVPPTMHSAYLPLPSSCKHVHSFSAIFCSLFIAVCLPGMKMLTKLPLLCLEEIQMCISRVQTQKEEEGRPQAVGKKIRPRQGTAVVTFNLMYNGNTFD